MLDDVRKLIPGDVVMMHSLSRGDYSIAKSHAGKEKQKCKNSIKACMRYEIQRHGMQKVSNRPRDTDYGHVCKTYKEYCRIIRYILLLDLI